MDARKKRNNERRNLRRKTVGMEEKRIEVEDEINGGRQEIREVYREVWEEEKRERGMEGDERGGEEPEKRELAIQNEREEGRGGKKRRNGGNGGRKKEAKEG